MADDLLGGIFGPQATDPLGDIFGAKSHTAPNPQWTSDPLASPQQDNIGKALSGGIAPAPRIDLSQPLRDAPQVHPSARDEPTDVPSYLAHGLESGLASAAGMAGDVAESLNPVTMARNLWLSTANVAHQAATVAEGVIGGDGDQVLYGDKSAAIQSMAEQDASTPFTRFAEQMQRDSATLANSPDGAKYNDLRYATTDPSKAAWLSPVKMVHDVLQSLPSTAAMATTVYLTRGAAAKAYGEAITAGFSKTEAAAIATKAAGRVATLAGAFGEGTVGGYQQDEQERVQVLDGGDPKTRVYQTLIKAGVSAKDAKQYLASEAGKVAGLGAGLVDGITNALEGPILGRIISEGGPLASRIGKGFLTEGTQEAVQGAGEQVSQNEATREYVDPQQKLADGVAENVLASFAVGGLTGGMFSAVGGHAAHPDTQAPGVQDTQVSADLERGAPAVTPEDHASPLPTDLIQQGKGAIANDLDLGAHNDVLRQNGAPNVGARVELDRGPLGKSTGSVLGSFGVTDDQGTQHGIRLGLDDGSTYEELFKDIQSGGHSINELIDKYLPETKQGPLPTETETTVNAAGEPQALTVKGGKSGIPTDVVHGLMAHGIPETVARGAAAGIVAESGGDENALNKSSGAFGLGQWLGSRKQALIERYGPNPTREQQIEFLAHELKGGDPGGKFVLAASDEASALHAYITKFMRPAAGAETTGDLKRGLAALGGGTLNLADLGFRPAQEAENAKPSDEIAFANNGDLAPEDQAAAKPFDAETFDRERADTIAASKAAGNQHLDDLEPSVETMRGKPIFYAHDP